jgi:hypothetical protein
MGWLLKCFKQDVHSHVLRKGIALQDDNSKMFGEQRGVVPNTLFSILEPIPSLIDQ